MKSEFENLNLTRAGLEGRIANEQGTILDTISLGICCLKNRKIQWANAVLSQMLGYGAEELLELDFSVFYPEHDDYQRMAAEAYGQIAKGAAYSIEGRVKKKDGGLLWCSITGRAISLDPEEGSIWVLQDITERKQAEEALHRLNRELHAISDCHQIMVRAENEQSLLNEICRIICDKAGYRMAWVGYAENDDGKSIHPVAWAGFEDGYLAQASISWADTERGRGPGGTVIRSGKSVYSQDLMTDPMFAPWRQTALERGYRSGIFLPLKDEKARTFGALNIYSAVPNAFTGEEIRLLEELAENLAFGITVLRTRLEREHAEEALKESKEYLNQILNSISDPIFVKDGDDRFALVNDAFCRLNVRRRDEVLGKAVSELDPDGLMCPFFKHGEEILASGKERTFHTDIPDAKGNPRTFIAKMSPLYHENGGRQIVCVLRDITEYMRLQAQFMQSQKMEAIGVLAGGVAHDFNNLLNVINGYCELMLDDLDAEDPKRKDLEQIGLAGKRAVVLTSQLLAFSRKQILQPEILDLNNVITGMSSMLRRLIRESIELAVIAQPGLGRIHADPGQIQQIIMNLAVNSRDAMPQGGKLTIETVNVNLDEDYVRQHPVVRPGSYVMLAISDNGTGMDAATRARLFEPFFTTKARGKGTGLGLSTVYGIVKQSNGYIWVYSEIGRGTTFKLYFPRVEEEAGRFAEEQNPEQATRGWETVLVTEDEPSVRALTARILRDLGYTVFEASNGSEALETARNFAGEIHLLITDIVMPGMGGKTLASQLKTFRPDTKVLFVSGYTDNAIVHHGILDPDVAFLQKPFTLKNLSRKVREVIDSR